MTPKSEWIWMPHAGHFICSRDCQFFLNTWVGNFIVSTVGEMVPDEPVREIYAQSRGVTLKGMGDERLADYMKKIGFEDLGYERKYETMVFPAIPNSDKYQCCPFIACHGKGELDMRGYNDPTEATNGHYELCEKWSKEPAIELTPEDLEPPRTKLRKAMKDLRAQLEKQ